jgi:hypothetical protein
MMLRKDNIDSTDISKSKNNGYGHLTGERLGSWKTERVLDLCTD